MIELNQPEFSSVIPLLAGIKQKVLPQAISQGLSPGRIFVDVREAPQLALIWSAVGYYFVAGDPAMTRDLTAASRVLIDAFIPASQAGGESGFILVPSDESWIEHIPRLLPGREVIHIYRRPFRFDAVRFSTLGKWREHIPPEFRLEYVGMDLAEKIGALAAWSSPSAFCEHGLGVALFSGDKIASVCTSVFASLNRMEIDVHTEEQFQRQGLAFLAAAAFIEECLRRGKQPNWECFWENEPSTSLALKLGFTAEPDYPVCFWEE